MRILQVDQIHNLKSAFFLLKIVPNEFQSHDEVVLVLNNLRHGDTSVHGGSFVLARIIGEYCSIVH